jgi:hypothetical protein
MERGVVLSVNDPVELSVLYTSCSSLDCARHRSVEKPAMAGAVEIPRIFVLLARARRLEVSIRLTKVHSIERHVKSNPI